MFFSIFPLMIRFKIICIIILVMAAYSLSAQFSGFPGPGNDQVRSPYYKVWLKVPSGEFEEQYVYISYSEEDPGRSISFVQFDYSGKVTIRVEKSGSTADTVLLRPARYLFSDPVLEGDTFTFALNSLDPPPSVNYTSRKISVEFQDEGITAIHEAPSHGLMLFANPPEDPEWVPDTASPEVFMVPAGNWDGEVPTGNRIVFFHPGMYHISDSIWYIPPEVDQVYLAGGAFVRGLFYLQYNPDFLINGRGVLSGFNLPHADKIIYMQGSAAGENARHIFFRQGCENMTVEGITLMNHNHHTVTGWFNNPLIRNIKIIGWVFNTDGTRTGNGVVEECFFHCNDDAIWVFDDSGTVRNCVFWHYRNGGCFQFGWGGGDNSGVRVHHIDVIHAEWAAENTNPNNGVFNLRLKNPSSGEQRDFLFDDIQVETPVLRVFDFDMVNETKGDGGSHRMRDFTFRNINARMMTTGSRSWNYFEPWDQTHGFRNFRFEDLAINGLQVTEGNWRDARFMIDPRSVGEIHFDNPESIPRVVITYPEHLSVTEKGDTILIATMAEDPDGTIDSVQIYNHEQLLSTTREAYHGFYYPVTTTRDLALTAIAFDNDGNRYRFGPVEVKVFGAHDIPGRIEAEDYERMAGIQTEPALDDGGGLNIGYINSGNYATYRVSVAESGPYTVDLRVASGSNGGIIEIYKNAGLSGSVTVENTGGWQEWKTLTTEMELEGGEQELMLYFRGGEGYLMNLNWFDFRKNPSRVDVQDRFLQLKIYPNPVMAGIVSIEGSTGRPVSVSLLDGSGRILVTHHGIVMPVSLVLPGNLAPGMYFMWVSNNATSWYYRLIIE